MNAVSIFLDRIGMQAYDVDYCYTPYTCSAVCLCVYLLVTTVSHTKTDEPIEMSFGGWITLNLLLFAKGQQRCSRPTACSNLLVVF